MSMTYDLISQDNTEQIQMNVRGDDVTTVLHLNLSMSPFSLNFDGGAPIGCIIDTKTNGFIQATGVFSTDVNGHVLLAVTFSPAPPSNNDIGPNITFQYQG